MAIETEVRKLQTTTEALMRVCEGLAARVSRLEERANLYPLVPNVEPPQHIEGMWCAEDTGEEGEQKGP